MSAVQYLLAVCDTADQRASLARQWAGNVPPMRYNLGRRIALFISGANQFVPMRGSFGAIIGDLFRRSGPTSPVREVNEVLNPGLHGIRTISNGYWGAYITCFEEDEAVTVGRDPSGMLPCFSMTIPGATIFSSDVAIIFRATRSKPEIVWSNVARTLYTRNLPTTSTCLKDITELLPGTAANFRRGVSPAETFWSPWDFLPGPAEDDYERHAETVRIAVSRCISSLGGTYAKILVGVSGGLDSSIVAATLADIGTVLSCLTMVTDDPVGDERVHAAELCRHISAPLRSAYYSFDDVDISRSAFAHLPRPGARTEALAFDAAIGRGLAEDGCDAFFSGNGGDNVFFLSRSARALADVWIAKGPSRTTWQAAKDIADLTGATLARVFREAWRFIATRDRRYRWVPSDRFLHGGVAAGMDACPIHHPWLNAPAGVPPGKAAHIALLLRLQPYVACYDRSIGIPRISPLAAQPIVEACLAVPTWLSCRGGHDRSVARAAFAPLLPASLAWRRSKGGPDGFAIDILKRQLPAIRQRLLRGSLANAGLLDIPSLDQALSPDSLIHNWDYPRILSLLDTEAWLEAWHKWPAAT